MTDKYRFGIDIGGTKIEAALYSSQSPLKEVLSRRISTDRDKGYDDVMDRLANLLITLVDEGPVEWSQVEGVGVGLPGTVDPQSQTMLNGNSRIFIGKSFRQDLQEKLPHQLPIICNNDASCFALAESHLGAGKAFQERTGIPIEKQLSIGIILGTGCGGGIIMGGKILNGHHGGGGEIGHSVLIPGGRDCYCGRKGCAEQYLCGPSIEKAYGKDLKARKIFDLAKNGEEKAQKIISEYRHNLLEFLTNLTSIFDPHFFVLGGGVSKQDYLYQGLEKKLHAQTFVPQSEPMVFQHQISDSAGVLGAALLLS